MTMTRTGDAWMPADEYGRALPNFSVNLLVRDLSRSLSFYQQVLGATVRYSDTDFAALVLNGVDFMLHADHTYDHHPLHTRLQDRRKTRHRSRTSRDGHRPGQFAKACGGSRRNHPSARGGFSAWMARRNPGRSRRLYLGGRRTVEQVIHSEADKPIRLTAAHIALHINEGSRKICLDPLASGMNRDTIQSPARQISKVTHKEKRMNLAALRCGFVAVVLSGAGLAIFAQDTASKRPITFDDLRSMHRVASPTVSPDGKWIAYSVATPDMDANRNASNIWAVPATGGAAIQLTQSGHDSAPAWSPDSKTLAFISSRDGNSQVYVLSMEGGESHAITHIAGGADLVKWSPDGSTIAFTSSVYVDCKDDACNSARDAEKEKNKVKARVYEQLLYRHWTHWSEGKRSHLFVAPADGSGTPRDLTAGANYDVPPDERGGPDDINFSPDGKEICFTAVPDKVEALSTNGELFIVPVTGGEAKKITTNAGFDGNPVYSPDGNYIAYHAQLTPGYEADRWRVMRYDRHTEKTEDLTEKFDRSAEGLAWSPDSKMIYFTAENETLSPIYALDARGGAEPKKIVAEGFNTAVSISRDGKIMAFERTSLTMPAEVFVATGEGANAQQVTHHNDALLAQARYACAGNILV